MTATPCRRRSRPPASGPWLRGWRPAWPRGVRSVSTPVTTSAAISALLIPRAMSSTTSLAAGQRPAGVARAATRVLRPIRGRTRPTASRASPGSPDTVSGLPGQAPAATSLSGPSTTTSNGVGSPPATTEAGDRYRRRRRAPHHRLYGCANKEPRTRSAVGTRVPLIECEAACHVRFSPQQVNSSVVSTEPRTRPSGGCRSSANGSVQCHGNWGEGVDGDLGQRSEFCSLVVPNHDRHRDVSSGVVQ